MSQFIGPVIPKHLKKSPEQSKADDDGAESDIIGPALPPGWTKDEDEEENQIIGPVLPPHLKKRPLDEASCTSSVDRGNKIKKTDPPKSTKKVIGPTLPPGFGAEFDESPSHVDPVSSSALNDESDEDDEFTIGPLPPSGNFIEVEESRHQKSRAPIGPAGPQREEWIASLPQNSSVAQKLGFAKSMTSFASKPVTTKEITPVDQDSELDKAVDEYNKATRPEALVDMHKKKVKEKKPEEAPTRHLFDFNPEEDLKVRQLDSQQTKSIMEKAKLLNSRFSNPRGQNKFL